MKLTIDLQQTIVTVKRDKEATIGLYWSECFCVFLLLQT